MEAPCDHAAGQQEIDQSLSGQTDIGCIIFNSLLYVEDRQHDTQQEYQHVGTAFEQGYQSRQRRFRITQQGT